MAESGNLASELDAITGQIPPAIGERIERSLDEIAASGTASGLAVGERAPEFALPDALGNKVSLAERLTAGPVVVVFYRGEWCPYCNVYLRALQAALPAIRDRGASLIAISPQSPDHSLSITEKAELAFDVVSDEDQSVIRDYRAQFGAPAELQAVHLDVFKVDVRLQNADDSWNLPVPATFVVAQDGTVAAAHVDVDYRKRMEQSDIIRALDALA